MTAKISKISRKNAVILLIIAAAILACLVMLCASPGCSFGKTELINVQNAEGRQKYLRSFGWEIDLESEEERSVLLPKEFDGVLTEYGKMQSEQGYDFASYAGTECRQYTYLVTNYGAAGTTVYAVLYIRGSRVIGADIHSADINGFMHGIK